jgi:hypothetical protein
VEDGVEVAGRIESETGTGGRMFQSDSPSRAARQLATSTWFTYLAQSDDSAPARYMAVRFDRYETIVRPDRGERGRRAGLP